MKTLLLSIFFSLILSLVFGAITIPILKKIRAGQPILKYVETHKEKSGTPTMGGLFFVCSAVIVFIVLGGIKNRIASVSVIIGLAFLVVGFLDDFLKIKFRKNQGLKAYQKISFQIAIATIAGVFAFQNGMTVFILPFSKQSVNLGYFTIPIVAIIFIAITNSVNLTDGLDGLAASVSVVYLLGVIALVFLQTITLKHLYLMPEEYMGIQLLCSCLVGALLGFLVYNQTKAKVFMGDTGSLSLGGFIGAVSVFSANSFFIPIIGIMFVFSSISVIVQVLHYKRTRKRVLLMAPLHHHFQLKGKSEPQITFCYSLITFVMVLLSLYCYL